MKIEKNDKSWARYQQQIVVRVTNALYETTKKAAMKYKVTPTKIARRALEKYITELGFVIEESKERLP